MVSGCKCSSDYLAALACSIYLFTLGSLKAKLTVCPYGLLSDFTASYTRLFFHLYTLHMYGKMLVKLTNYGKVLVRLPEQKVVSAFNSLSAEGVLTILSLG